MLRTQFFKVAAYLLRTVAVVGDFTNSKTLRQLGDESHYVVIVHHIALGGVEHSCLFPYGIRNVVAPCPQVNHIFRQPVKRHHCVFGINSNRWEYQNQSRKVSGTGKVETAIAIPTLVFFEVYVFAAGVPFVHRHPPDIGVAPFVQAELPKVHLLGGVLFRLFIGSLHRFKGNRYVDGWIDPSPDGFVIPIVIFFNAEYGRIEGRINF